MANNNETSRTESEMMGDSIPVSYTHLKVLRTVYNMSYFL